jgi:hypothetical protein
MSTNRDLLKEAIADAKAVKDTAIANAKMALEEAFTPHLKSMFSAKINEMIEEEDIDEDMDYDDKNAEQIKNERGHDTGKGFGSPKHYGDVKVVDDYTDNTFKGEEGRENEKVVKGFYLDEDEDEINLEELMSELEKDEMEEVINDPRGPGAHGNIAYGGMSDDALMEAEEETEEEMSIEDMSEGDLKDFIESVIKDMVEAGEIEAGHEEESEEEEEEGESIDEFLNEMEGDDLKEYGQEGPISTEDALKLMDMCKRYPEDEACKGLKESKASKAAKLKSSKELEEAYSVIRSMKKDINEVNLLNAKLLYTNKIFRSKSLTESQKINVLGAFDRATTAKEAKLVYESLLSNLKTPTRNIQENLGRASKSITVPQTKQPIIESNDMIARFQKLAGII